MMPASAPGVAVPDAPAFAAWLDDFFAAYYRRRPVNATFIGVHDRDDRLPDLSEAGMDETVAEMATLRRRLRTLPPERLTPAARLDRQLTAGFLEIQLWEFASGHGARGNPSFYIGEAAFGAIALFLRPFAPLPDRVAAATARLAAVPALLEQGRAAVRRAPPTWTERAIRECDGALAFFRGGVDMLIAAHRLEGESVRRAADTAATAVADFRRYLETELRARPADADACGAEALDLLLRQGHFVEQDADAIAAAARERIDACTVALARGAPAMNATNPAEALARLADHHPTAEGYYARYAQVWEAARAEAVRHELVTWPDIPIRYVPRPPWTRAAAPSLYFLFYRSPAPFDNVTPVEYLVAPVEPDMPPAEQEALLRATNDSVIKLNHVVHHGGLGHHLQNWHAGRAASRVGRVAAVDCASRIALFCGGTMAEGWACYATDLMDEVGFLTPLERYAEAQSRLRMAARALVDVELHRGRLTLNEAAALYREQAYMAPDAARAEAVRASMFPGTALMYMVGTDGIHALRREQQARLGAAFNPRDFHDRFLSHGSVPVSLIGATMREEDTHVDDHTRAQ